jgi:hypothetical protein
LCNYRKERVVRSDHYDDSSDRRAWPTRGWRRVWVREGRTIVWTTNERLQHYYLKQGFTYVRTVVLPHNPSGALFQRPAERVPTPRLQEVESLTG